MIRCLIYSQREKMKSIYCVKIQLICLCIVFNNNADILNRIFHVCTCISATPPQSMCGVRAKASPASPKSGTGRGLIEGGRTGSTHQPLVWRSQPLRN